MTEVSMSEHVHGHGGRPAPGPFGFYTPYEPAPAPPPGPALLDDSESSMLNSFFTSMNANPLDNSEFWFNLGDHGSGRSHFDWPDLPPNFEGSTTCLPSHHVVSQRIHREVPLGHKPGAHSSDVLAAASMLYQNGANGNDYSSTFTSQIFTENGLEDISSHNAERKPNRFPLQEDARKPHFALGREHQVFANEEPHHTRTNPDDRPHASSKEHMFGPLRWGSDSGFAEQGYRVPPDQPTMEERTTELLHNLDCFESQSSAPNTRPSSPNPRRRPSNRTTSDWSSLRSPNSMKQYSPTDSQMDNDSRPAKRRKNKGGLKEEDDTFVQSPLGRPTTARNRRWSSNSGAQARRSKAHSLRPPRENLTEEQKRANHILSEQKRRNLIKQGFDELCSLVPELRGGGFSKSTMLAQAADWLQDLLHGNEMLRHQLEDLKAQTGG